MYIFEYLSKRPAGVIVYSLEDCPACAQVKAYLRARGVQFEVRDGSGMGLVPIIEANGRRIVGFNPRELDRVFS